MRDRLIELERRFAPEIRKGRAVFSPLDPNPHVPWELGGDKMGPDRHGYADLYAQVLDGFVPDVVVELGVFEGSSLALWDAVWPDVTLIGLDLDFTRFNEQLPTLKAAGAFATRAPALVTFDAYGEVTPLVDALEGRAISLFVDDGPHTSDAIRRMASNLAPLMADRFVYVIEDYLRSGPVLDEFFPDAGRLAEGEWSAAFSL